jgi:hypothetical protein
MARVSVISDVFVRISLPIVHSRFAPCSPPDTIDVEMRETVKDKSLITGVVNRGQSENELLARKFLQKHLK